MTTIHASGDRGIKNSIGAKALRRAGRKVERCLRAAQYYWYHKCVFGITNTKFDISYCVFRESFLNDQYNIRKFLDDLGSAENLLFLDIGRNHGFVFYYTMYHIMKTGFPVSVVNYYGIDPSPLKFVYFNFHRYLKSHGITIKYNIIDRAVVFGDETIVNLKYGEDNFGNFNIAGSNYAERLADSQSRYEYVEIAVETIKFSEIAALIRRNIGSDALIIKIDCKNRTDDMFMKILDMLPAHQASYLLSCERDGSCDRDVSAYAKKDSRVLTVSNIAGRT